MNSITNLTKRCYNLFCGKLIHNNQRSVYCGRDCMLEVRDIRTLKRMAKGKILENSIYYPHIFLPVQLVIDDDWADKINEVIGSLLLNNNQ